MNKTIAETMHANIEKVGLPTWTEAVRRWRRPCSAKGRCPKPAGDQDQRRCADVIDSRRGEARRRLRRYRRHRVERADRDAQLPIEHSGRAGHNWANAISMATPIATRGSSTARRVVALTVIDILTKPEIVTQAWTISRT